MYNNSVAYESRIEIYITKKEKSHTVKKLGKIYCKQKNCKPLVHLILWLLKPVSYAQLS